jgi:hypothetical protein
METCCFSFEAGAELIKFSRASSRVKWLKVDKTDVSRIISVLVLRETEVGCNPVHVVAVRASNLISLTFKGLNV